jgi:RNA polymerase sigma-70 factor (ECF subfamily)
VGNRQTALLAGERQLMQRCVDGDRNAFAELYNFYAPLLFNIVFPLTNRSRQDTEEIIQDLFVKLWSKRDKMLTIQSFRPFIFRVARNGVIDWYRKNETKKEYSTFYHEINRESSVSVTDELLFQEYYSIALEAIDKLSPRQKQIFNLRHTEDLSLDEIAAKLGISIFAVKKQLYEAIRFVKEYLRKHGEWMLVLPFLFFFGN